MSWRLRTLGLVAALAAAGPLHSSPAAAGDRRDGLASCGEARTKAERLRLRCWRFDAAERGTYRAYDRENLDRRDWNKRDWED